MEMIGDKSAVFALLNLIILFYIILWLLTSRIKRKISQVFEKVSQVATKDNTCPHKQSNPPQTIDDKSINLLISQPASHPVNWIFFYLFCHKQCPKKGTIGIMVSVKTQVSSHFLLLLVSAQKNG